MAIILVAISSDNGPFLQLLSSHIQILFHFETTRVMGATYFYYIGQNFHIWIRHFPSNLSQVIKSKSNFARYSSIDLKMG